MPDDLRDAAQAEFDATLEQYIAEYSAAFAAWCEEKAEAEKIGKAKRRAKLKAIDRQRPAIVQIRNDLAAALTTGLAKLGVQAADALIAVRGTAEKAAGDDDDDDPLGELDWELLINPTQRQLRAAAEDGGREALAQIGFSSEGITDLVNERGVEFADARGAELVGMRWDGSKWIDNPDARWAISHTTRDMLRADVATAMEEGWSNDRFAKEIRENYAFSASRAETIARTETAKADVQGNLIAYRASGQVQGKEWIVGSEHDDDDECDDNEAAGVIGIDEAFPDGSDGPPAHPNCVCDVLPVLTDEGEAEAEPDSAGPVDDGAEVE